MTTAKSLIIYLLIGFSMIGNGCDKVKQPPKKLESKQQTIDKNNDQQKSRIILFFGNSLTAGYGVDPEDAFPSLVQNMLDSLNLPYKTVNAGLSGETTASGVNRIEWVLREPADILILELGGNDGLRGIDPEESKRNLQKIIDLARENSPGINIIIAGMEAPPNMGETYATSFRSIFKDLAVLNELPLIPFLLEGVGGEPKLNLDDGIHPNEPGHRIVAANVWTVLADQLN